MWNAVTNQYVLPERTHASLSTHSTPATDSRSSTIDCHYRGLEKQDTGHPIPLTCGADILRGVSGPEVMDVRPVARIIDTRSMKPH